MRLKYSLSWFILFAIIIFARDINYAQKPPGGYRPEEIICKMEPSYSVEIINNAYGTVIKSHQLQTDCYLLATPAGQNADSLAEIIDARPDVAYCRANYYLTAPEPFQRTQPFLDVSCIGDINLQTAATQLQLDESHLISEGEGVRIAIIDGGVNLTHPYFAASPENLVSRWDYIDNDSIANDEPGGSGSGHGTSVAGIAKLVAPAAQLYIYRVLDTSGLGDGYNIASAVLMAVEDSCRVINLSLGMVGIHDALDDALKYAKTRDIMIVASAGNDSTDNNLIFPFPAERMYCLAVAAIDSLNRKAIFSNYGVKVDICAAGTAIYAPYLDTLYAWWDGTSFSAPFVSGLAALLFSQDSMLTLDEADSAILKSGTNIDSINPGYEGMLGYGALNILASLESMIPIAAGDLNGDKTVNVIDVTYLINFLYKHGPVPLPNEGGDLNGDLHVNALDVTYLINFLYKNGPPPLDH